jgi:flagellar basal-body rod protein FlgB
VALFSGSSGLQKEARDEFPGQGTPVGGATHMALGDLPLLSMMKLRLQWLGERQQVLAQNVANADTPGYDAKDLKELDFGALVKQQSGMLSPVANSVVLEEQMMKAAQTQMDYQAVTGLYAKSVGLIKIALGRG